MRSRLVPSRILALPSPTDENPNTVSDDRLVVVIGDAMVDVRVAPSEPMRPGGDVPASIGMHPGGQGANVAVRLARRGVRVRLVTAIGDDAIGAWLRGLLVGEGIEVTSVPAERTSTVVLLVDPAGERTMLSQRAELFSPSFELAAITDADWLIVSGYALLEPSAGLSVTGATPRRVVLGCSLGSADVERWVSRAASLSPHLMVVNADEASTLGPGEPDPPALARALASRFGSVVVVTRPTGAVAAVGGDVVETDAAPGGHVVDTTGAGDAYAAALVADLLDADWPPPLERLRRAMLAGHRLATAVVGTVGAQARVEDEG